MFLLGVKFSNTIKILLNTETVLIKRFILPICALIEKKFNVVYVTNASKPRIIYIFRIYENNVEEKLAKPIEQ